MIVIALSLLRNLLSGVGKRLKGVLQDPTGRPLSDKIVLNLFLVTLAGLIMFIPLNVFRSRLMGVA